MGKKEIDLNSTITVFIVNVNIYLKVHTHIV